MENLFYFKPSDLKEYLRSLKGIFSKQDIEILIALTARKAYEDRFENIEEMQIGFELKPGVETELNKEQNFPINKIGSIIHKFSKIDTLTDAVIGRVRNGIAEKNPIKLQIKRFGLGKQLNGGTGELIKLLEKHKTDAANNERLILYFEETRGFIDTTKIEEKFSMDTIPYKEVITIHYTKPDNFLHIIRLKPKQGDKYGYKSFTQEQVITI